MSKSTADIIGAFESRRAVIGVVGLGYVGLPILKCFHNSGFRCVGYDIDSEKIVKLRKGESYLIHLSRGFFEELAQSERFTPTDRPEDLSPCDAIIICVPTPLGHHREPDLSYVEKSSQMVARVMKPGCLVVLTSTSYPLTTREVTLPALESTGRRLGQPDGFYLCFSPEREDPGRKGFERGIPRLLGGIDEVSGRVGMACLSAAVEKVYHVETAEIAEAAKILENTYRCINIALVNELKPVLAAMGIDIWKVIAAASTKPFGFQAFYPGPGLGGHCIPIDPFYLTWKAREIGMETKFIELAGEINTSMPHYVVDRVGEALNDEGKPVRGSDVLVIGLAYKPNIDDVRETPAAEIITLLGKRGAQVSYHDPHVPHFPRMRHYDHDMSSEALTAERLRRADCVLVVTDHDAIDWGLIARESRLVVDTRNAMARAREVRARVVKA